MNSRSTAVFLALISLIVWTGHAATLVWTNIADGNWTDATSWDPHGIPGLGDIAKITGSGNFTVTLNQNVSMLGVIVGNQTAGVQNFVLAPGVTLTATGPITINDNGTLTISGGATLNLENTAPLYLIGPGVNSGTINLTNNFIYLYNDGTLTADGGLLNNASGQINLRGNGGTISAAGPLDYLRNLGQISKAAGSGTSLLQADTHLLEGTYNAPAGTTLTFGGGIPTAPLQGQPSLVLNGPGQFQFVSGDLLFPLTVISNLVLTGGTLHLGAAFEGGSITNLALDGITLTNTLPVTGVLNMTNGTSTGAFTVANGGVWNAYGATFSGQATIGNGGRFFVGTASTLGAINVTNAWITVSSGGVLDIAGALTVDQPITNSGTINATNGVSVQTQNSGAASLVGGLVNLPAGAINLWGNSSLFGVARGNEYLINQGAINQMSGSGQSTVDFNFFTNTGTLTARHGTLLLESPHILFASSQTMGVTLNSATDYGKISFVGAAPFTGAFSVSLGGGYVPPVGTSFSVASYTSLASGFTSFLYPATPAAVAWQPAYGSTVLTLQMQLALAPVLSGTGLAIKVNGLPNHQAIELTSTNLTIPIANWTPLSTNPLGSTGFLSLTNNLNRAEPRRFFVFKIP